MRKAHSFTQIFDLPTDLEDWIAAFCGRRTPHPSVGPSFPALAAGETEADWFVDQFDRLRSEPGKRDQLRTIIVRLIATHGGRDQLPQSRDQITGTLLNVARELKFVEITPHLLEWIRKPWFREPHIYILGSAELPLRRTVWEVLLGWGCVEGVVPHLTEMLTDLAMSGENGTAQIAFVALGERDPSAALRLVPEAVKVWPLAYWISTVTQFLRSVGVRALLNPKHAQAWSVCLGRCLYALDVDPYIRDARPFAEADTLRPNHLYEPIETAGIQLDDRENGEIVLSGLGVTLKVNVCEYFFPVEFSAEIPEKNVSVGLQAFA